MKHALGKLGFLKLKVMLQHRQAFFLNITKIDLIVKDQITKENSPRKKIANMLHTISEICKR